MTADSVDFRSWSEGLAGSETSAVSRCGADLTFDAAAVGFAALVEEVEVRGLRVARFQAVATVAVVVVAVVALSPV